MLGLTLTDNSFQSSADTLTNGLIAWWKFDESTVRTFIDSSGHNNTGSFTAAVRTGGVLGGGLLFTGSSASNWGTSSAINLTSGAITIAGWMNTQWNNLSLNNFPFIIEASNYNTTVGIGFAIATGAFLDWHSNQILLFGNGFNAGQNPRGICALPSSLTSTTTGWHHFAGVMSANTVQIYIDAIPQAMLSASVATLPTINVPLAIGGNFGRTNDYLGSGSIDDIRIYNRVLSQSEITQIYNLLG